MKFKKEKSILELERDSILKNMQELDPASDMYKTMCDRVDCLTGLINNMKSKKSVSPDTVALIAANLAGIIIVLAWEEKHVIATKAFGMISKLRF